MNNIYSGNINIALTPFVFDKIYQDIDPNPEDNVAIGRYVLSIITAGDGTMISRVFQKRFDENTQPIYLLVCDFNP